MNLQEKLALIEEVLDVETGSLVVMLDEKFEKTVSGVQIKALASVNDILDYMD